MADLFACDVDPDDWDPLVRAVGYDEQGGLDEETLRQWKITDTQVARVNTSCGLGKCTQMAE